MATVAELQKRLAALEAEVAALKAVVAAGGAKLHPIDAIFGVFADDPLAREADRLGREYRERINKKSLAEFDREEKRMKAKAGKKPAKKRTPTARGADARS
jgi:hypothetical protein